MILFYLRKFSKSLCNLVAKNIKALEKTFHNLSQQSHSRFSRISLKKQKFKLSNTLRYTSKRLIQYCISHLETTQETPP